MIIFNILQSSDEVADEMAAFVMEKGYALDTHVDTNTIIGKNGRKRSVRLFFVTRSLLFSEIEEAVTARFGNENLVMYAEPVSHISREFGENLRKGIREL